MHRSEITLYVEAIRSNTSFLIKTIDGAELWAVVKANAYGHGAEPVARAALEAGARALCVATVDEAQRMREAFPACRIIILGSVTPQEIAHAQDAELECVAHDETSLAILASKVSTHIWLNTGMNHWGFDGLPSHVPSTAVGIMSHFSRAYSSLNWTAHQTRIFVERASAYPNLPRHLANSAAALGFPPARLEAVRCGAALLGLSPYPNSKTVHGLVPALRWTSYLAQTRTIAAGESVGYGNLVAREQFIAPEKTLIGIVPVGYADGFDRRLCGTEVVVGDSMAQVIGRISMDAFAVKLDRPAPVGTPVVLIGEEIAVERHAVRTGVFNIELCAGLSLDQHRTRRLCKDTSPSSA